MGFKQFLKESKHLNEDAWDNVYNEIKQAEDCVEIAEDMWNGDSHMGDMKFIIKKLEENIKHTQKAILLLKNYHK